MLEPAGKLQQVGHILYGRAALLRLAADVHLQQDALDDVQLFGLSLYIEEQFFPVCRLDEARITDDVFYLIAL